MQFYMALLVAALFFLLTPGIVTKLPPGGNKYTVAAAHAVLFAVIYALIHKAAWHSLYPEGFKAVDMKDVGKKMMMAQQEPSIPAPSPMSPVAPM